MNNKNCPFILSKEDYDHLFDQMRFAPSAINAGRDHRSGAKLVMLRFREDWRQMVCEVALKAEAEGLKFETDAQYHGYFRSYFYRQVKNYGFTRVLDINGECCGGWTKKEVGNGDEDSSHPLARVGAKVYPTCGIPGCTARKVYNDEHYGALCRKHGQVVVKRRERNWSDPYLGLETAKVSVGAKYLPKENRQFWTLIRMFVSDEEWIAMWEWAKGRTPDIDQKVLKKARAAIESVEPQPKG